MLQFLPEWISSLFYSTTVSTLLSHVLQVYCFTYGLLYILTCLLTFTNFIYAESLLNLKPIGVISFVLLYSMKLWTSFQSWMVYVGYFMAIYMAVYFYDACCNMTQKLTVDRYEQSTRNGTILLLINLGLICWYVSMNLTGLSKHDRIGIFGPKESYVFLGLTLVLFGINLYRMRQRSLFPFLLVTLFTAITLIVRQFCIRHNILPNIPLQSIIYLLLILDAEGREFKQVQNKLYHNLFFACLHFYGYVITNERSFHIEYFFLGIAIFMMLINK